MRWTHRVAIGLLLGLDAWSGPLVAQERLPNVRVSAKSPCEIHPETARETADLWVAAREALRATSDTTGTPPMLLIQEWRRTLDPRMRLRFERRDTSRVSSFHPFENPLPGNVERAGYIQRRGWNTVYYGPDSGLLLSEWFLRRHCFRRIEGYGGNTGLVGLGFAPLPQSRLTDVAGVLWIDLGSGELRHVEYSWTNAPEEARALGVGGRADFVRLTSGGWIVQRWNIRMPRPRTELDGTLDGYNDQGGEVVAVGRQLPLKKTRP